MSEETASQRIAVLENALRVKELELERSKLEIQILQSRLKYHTQAAYEMVAVVLTAARRYEELFKDRTASPSAVSALTSLRGILEQVDQTMSEWKNSEESHG